MASRSAASLGAICLTVPRSWFPVLANRAAGRRTSRQTEAQAVGQSLIVTALSGEGEHAETQPPADHRFRLHLAPACNSLVSSARPVSAGGESVRIRSRSRPLQQE